MVKIICGSYFVLLTLTLSRSVNAAFVETQHEWSRVFQWTVCAFNLKKQKQKKLPHNSFSVSFVHCASFWSGFSHDHYIDTDLKKNTCMQFDTQNIAAAFQNRLSKAICLNQNTEKHFQISKSLFITVISSQNYMLFKVKYWTIKLMRANLV